MIKKLADSLLYEYQQVRIFFFGDSTEAWLKYLIKLVQWKKQVLCASVGMVQFITKQKVCLTAQQEIVIVRQLGR